MTPSEARSLHRRIASHYSEIQHYFYVRTKLATDPLYNAIFESVEGSAHELLDIGCGMGVLAFYLREREFPNAITGIDYDDRKIIAARETAARGNVERTRFVMGDARDALPDFRGNVSILDVLQFFEPRAQEELLRRAAKSIAPGASLLIRSGLREESWRFRVTRFGDFVARWTRWMKEAPTAYPTAEFIRGILESEGLEGNFSPLWGRTPFSNYLIVFRHPDGMLPGAE